MTAHVSHSPRPPHSAGRRKPKRFAASQRYVPSATMPCRPSGTNSTFTLIINPFAVVDYSFRMRVGNTRKYRRQKAKGKGRMKKAKGKNQKAKMSDRTEQALDQSFHSDAVFPFCLLPLAFCLLHPVLGAEAKRMRGSAAVSSCRARPLRHSEQ